MDISGKIGTSLAVRQFVAAARGQVRPHKEANPIRVETVDQEVRYCLACCGERVFDVVRTKGKAQIFAVCRCCGKVVS